MKLQIRRGLKTDLPTLAAGELGFCTDTKELYVGDGTTNHLVNTAAVLSALTIDADKDWMGKAIDNPGDVDGVDISAMQPDKRNLAVKVNATHPAYQIDVDADALQVGQYSLSSVNLTINIAASGANGLDTGSEAANKWYSIWVIYNPTTRTIAGLFSLSATSPTMPSGYTKKRRVGWVRNNASSNFLKFYQIGDWWHWDIHHNVLYTSGAATGWTDVICSGYVPPTSELILVTVRNKDSNSAVAITWLRRNGSSEDGADKHEFMIGAWGSTAVAMGVLGLTVSCDSSQIIEYRNDPGDELAIINVLGYYDPI